MDIALALGGGGIKGNVHIGVLRRLEQEGFCIRAIAGTSAGGMIGSFYAAGYRPDEIEARLAAVDQSKLYRYRRGEGPSFLGVTILETVFREMLSDRTFADLRIPFAVTAVELATAKLMALRRGCLCDAILATIAVPGVFPPRYWEDHLLIDGGVLDPVPVSLARMLAHGLPVVAVVPPPADAQSSQQLPLRLGGLPFIAKYLARLRVAQAVQIFMRGVDISGTLLTELRLQEDQPDGVIRPEVPGIGLLDPIDIHAVARSGEVAVEKVLPDLHRAVSWRGWLVRKISWRRIIARQEAGVRYES